MHPGMISKKVVQAGNKKSGGGTTSNGYNNNNNNNNNNGNGNRGGGRTTRGGGGKRKQHNYKVVSLEFIRIFNTKQNYHINDAPASRFVCKYVRSGEHCSFGSRCHWRHPPLASTNYTKWTEAPPPPN